jgi:hypothetical protein
MRDSVGTVVELAKAALIGYLTVAVAALCAVLVISGVAYLANVASFSLAIGPLPLMSYWRDGASWSFGSEWGLAFLTPIGAVVGLGMALLRRRAAHSI